MQIKSPVFFNGAFNFLTPQLKSDVLDISNVGILNHYIRFR